MKYIASSTKFILCVQILYIARVLCENEILQQFENEIVSLEWHQSLIGNIRYAKITYQNEIVVQNFKNLIMKYDFYGNQRWITETKIGELIKVQKDWAILLKQKTKSLVFIDLETGNQLHEINFGQFNDQLPKFKTSQQIFLMHDTQNIFWVKSIKNLMKWNNYSNNDDFIKQQSPTDNKQKYELLTGRYQASKTYEILNIQIDEEEKVHVLLQYKRTKICLAIMELEEDIENNLKLRRCRQMVYNQKVTTYASINGFLIQNMKDQDQSQVRIVFFDKYNESEEDNSFSMFSSEEDIHRTTENIKQILTFEQNEIILFKYENYSEICRLTPFDLVCPDIFIKKKKYQFVHTINYQSLLFLSNSQQKTLEGQQANDQQYQKELNAQIYDLESYQIFNFKPIKFEDNISLAYAKVNMKDPLQPSIDIIVQTSKHQVIFAQMNLKQNIIHSNQEGGLQNDLTPVFYRFYNSYQNPYPQTKSPNDVEPLFTLDQQVFSKSTLKMANSIIHNIIYRWKSDIEYIGSYFNEQEREIPEQQLIIDEDASYNDRMYGYEKMILIPTRQFRLFAFNSATGQLVYKKSIIGQAEQNEVVGLVRLSRDKNIVNGQYITEYHDDYIVIINNQDQIILQYITPLTGELLRSEIADLPNDEKYHSFLKVKIIPDSNREHLIFITNKLNTVFYPSLDLVERHVVDNQLKQNSIFFVKREKNALIYQLKDVSSGLQQTSYTKLKSVQKVIKVSHNHQNIDFTSKKQNFVPIQTDTKDAYRWIDFENRIYALLILIENEKKLIIYVIDTITNKLIFQKFMGSVKSAFPIDMYLHENRLYVTFFSDYYDKQIIYEMKIYFKYFLTIFSLPNPELPLDSVTCDVKTLFSEQTITKMHNVVLNNLIFTTHNNDIIFINLQKLNETETTLTNSSFSQINTYPLAKIQSIYIDKTSLTSRYLLFANGAQIYSVNFTPEERFDTLPLNFNYKAVINSIAICFTLLILSYCFYQIRTIRQKNSSF